MSKSLEETAYYWFYSAIWWANKSSRFCHGSSRIIEFNSVKSNRLVIVWIIVFEDNLSNLQRFRKSCKKRTLKPRCWPSYIYIDQWFDAPTPEAPIQGPI